MLGDCGNIVNKFDSAGNLLRQRDHPSMNGDHDDFGPFREEGV